MYHKSGSIAGVVNSAGVVQDKGRQVVLAICMDGVPVSQVSQAEAAMACLAKVVYDHYLGGVKAGWAVLGTNACV